MPPGFGRWLGTVAQGSHAMVLLGRGPLAPALEEAAAAARASGEELVLSGIPPSAQPEGPAWSLPPLAPEALRRGLGQTAARSREAGRRGVLAVLLAASAAERLGSSGMADLEYHLGPVAPAGVRLLCLYGEGEESLLQDEDFYTAAWAHGAVFGAEPPPRRFTAPSAWGPKRA